MICRLFCFKRLSAEREGFKPPVPVTVHLISNQAHSITLTPLRVRAAKYTSCSGLLEGFYILAEKERFELSIHFWRIHTFQACSFDHSDTSPKTGLQRYNNRAVYTIKKRSLKKGFASKLQLNITLCVYLQPSGKHKYDYTHSHWFNGL